MKGSFWVEKIFAERQIPLPMSTLSLAPNHPSVLGAILGSLTGYTYNLGSNQWKGKTRGANIGIGLTTAGLLGFSMYAGPRGVISDKTSEIFNAFISVFPTIGFMINESVNAPESLDGWDVVDVLPLFAAPLVVCLIAGNPKMQEMVMGKANRISSFTKADFLKARDSAMAAGRVAADRAATAGRSALNKGADALKQLRADQSAAPQNESAVAAFLRKAADRRRAREASYGANNRESAVATFLRNGVDRGANNNRESAVAAYLRRASQTPVVTADDIDQVHASKFNVGALPGEASRPQRNALFIPGKRNPMSKTPTARMPPGMFRNPKVWTGVNSTP